MVKIATKLEDIGDDRDQAVFMAAVKVWFDGDFQKALDARNRIVAKHWDKNFQVNRHLAEREKLEKEEPHVRNCAQILPKNES